MFAMPLCCRFLLLCLHEIDENIHISPSSCQRGLFSLYRKLKCLILPRFPLLRPDPFIFTWICNYHVSRRAGSCRPKCSVVDSAWF